VLNPFSWRSFRRSIEYRGARVVRYDALHDSPEQGGLAAAMASTRRLTAIFAADVAGYSRLMGVDEEGSMNASRRIAGS
jgi:hypothetical protein